jgi:hypothetical protein
MSYGFFTYGIEEVLNARSWKISSLTKAAYGCGPIGPVGPAQTPVVHRGEIKSVCSYADPLSQIGGD